MIFIELPIFTKLIKTMMTDEDYRLLQKYLICNPDAGDIIKGAKGLRKLRWKLQGGGKRGGLRVIYYWITAENKIYFFTVYKKSKTEDLTNEQLKILMEYLL